MHELSSHEYAPSSERVEFAIEMSSALDKTDLDIILCDHSLPNFDVFSALSLSRKHARQTPLFVVSGTVSEDLAVKALKAGDKDYILKNNLSRLVPAIEHELVETNTKLVYLKVEAELKKKELEFRQAQKLEPVVNGRDAMPQGGQLIIRTKNSFIPEDVALKTNTKSGSYTLLEVIDAGIGMTEETVSHIFDPIFTTKGVGNGTGLGLSTVYGILKQNKGTTFKVDFPQSDEKLPAA